MEGSESLVEMAAPLLFSSCFLSWLDLRCKELPGAAWSQVRKKKIAFKSKPLKLHIHLIRLLIKLGYLKHLYVYLF